MTEERPDLEQRAREMLADELREGFGYLASLALAATNPTTSPATPTKAALRAITKALASSSVPEQWQPIEACPRDGSPFLVYLPQAAWEPRLKPTMTVMYWASWQNFSSLYADRIGETEGDAGDWGPTNWMPLPPPPAPQDRGASQEDGSEEQAAPDLEERVGRALDECRARMAASRSRGGMINSTRAETPQSIPGTPEDIVVWLNGHLEAGACLSLSWIIDAIKAGEHLSTRQALEQGSAEGSRATAARQPAGAPSGLSPQAVSGEAAHQAQEDGEI